MSHQDGIPVHRFAAQIGVSERCLVNWCRAAKLATGTDRWRFPALKGGAE